MDRKDFLVKTLELSKHPEGGYYKEIYRSEDLVNTTPDRFNKETRNASTSIYYLLGRGNISKFHRIKSDEIWHYYEGDPIAIYVLNENGLKIEKIGRTGNGLFPQVVIKQGSWFAAESTGTSGYTLAGCTVSPGFDFKDFEIAQRIELIKKYPAFGDIIIKFS